MNPNTNRFEQLNEEPAPEDQNLAGLRRMVLQGEARAASRLYRPNGEPVPTHWSIFTLDELIEIKGYTFRVKYIGETSILFEPAGIPVIETGGPYGPEIALTPGPGR